MPRSVGDKIARLCTVVIVVVVHVSAHSATTAVPQTDNRGRCRCRDRENKRRLVGDADGAVDNCAAVGRHHILGVFTTTGWLWLRVCHNRLVAFAAGSFLAGCGN
jgi:hypothetical protein